MRRYAKPTPTRTRFCKGSSKIGGSANDEPSGIWPPATASAANAIATLIQGHFAATLETRPQPFGGRRWWFVCPRSGHLVAKLHLPNGAYTFASRRACRPGYRSQREAPRDRSITRAFKLRDRLGGEGGIGDYIPKPKWMRWSTLSLPAFGKSRRPSPFLSSQ
jgi:hypothetical protein